MSKESALNLSQVPTPAPQSLEAGVTTQTEPQIDSRRLALFAKKEKAIQDEREKFKVEQEAFKKKESEYDAVQKRVRDYEDLKAKDPIAALKLLGFTEADIFNYMSGTEKKEPTAEEIATKAAAEATAKLRQELEEGKKKDIEERNAGLIAKLKTDISDTIKTKSADLKFCAFRGVEAEALAYRFIELNLEENKIMISPEEALADAEEYYKNDFNELLEFNKPPEPIKDPSKVEVKFEASRKPVPPLGAKETPPKTLTNKMSATTASMANTVQKTESKDEKRTRLARQLGEALTPR